jgi:hypothetical protein
VVGGVVKNGTELAPAPGVRGRITDKQLPLAEESFPGIGRFYRDLAVKPATFLQLVWAYEGWLERRPIRRRRGAASA